MAIPVPIPSGALAVTDVESANAEALLAAFVQLVKSGSSGATLTTPALQVPQTTNSPTSGGVPVLVPIALDTAEKQLMHRQMFLAIAHLILQKVDASLTPAADKIPMADSGGHINYAWLVQDIWGETPSGTVNGTNKVFTTANTFRSGTTRVYLNGARQKPGTHYSESAGNTITFVSAPSSGAVLLVDYSR